MSSFPSLEKFLGGSLFSVALKLIFMCLVVGAVLAFVDLSPLELINRFLRFVGRVLNLGYEALGEFGKWAFSGALIVIPLFLIIRFWKTKA
jgi:hypothetical protein